jgi:hypothetical protein
MSELANTVAHTRAYINHGQCRVAAFVKRSKRASRSAGLASAPPRAHGLARVWTPGSPVADRKLHSSSPRLGHRDTSLLTCRKLLLYLTRCETSVRAAPLIYVISPLREQGRRTGRARVRISSAYLSSFCIRLAVISKSQEKSETEHPRHRLQRLPRKLDIDITG